MDGDAGCTWVQVPSMYTKEDLVAVPINKRGPSIVKGREALGANREELARIKG